MKKSLLVFVVVFLLAFVLGTKEVKAQKWEPVIEMDNNIYPSYVLATTNTSEFVKKIISNNVEYIGENYGVIGFKITGIPKDSNVKLEVSENDFFYLSSYEGKNFDTNKVYYIFPKINYKYERLRNSHQQSPINIEFKVYVDGELKERKILTSSIRALEEAPYITIEKATNKMSPMPWMFSAYVNEDSHIIDTILQRALKSGIVKSFNGYQSGDTNNVIKQVFAIWYSLQEVGVKYSSITNTSMTSSKVASQRVRMIEQSYKHSQANCVDGTVLLASVLKAIGIETCLVLVPNHMYLGVYLDKNRSNINVLETTMIGKIDLENVKTSQISENTVKAYNHEKNRLREISEFQLLRTPTEKQQAIQEQERVIAKLYKKIKIEASYQNFNIANQIAIDNYNKNKMNFGKNARYQVINISEARKIVKPIWR